MALTEKCIIDLLANVRGAIMMAYPMGLPEWDTAKLCLDSLNGLQVRFIAHLVQSSVHASKLLGNDLPSSRSSSGRSAARFFLNACSFFRSISLR